MMGWGKVTIKTKVVVGMFKSVGLRVGFLDGSGMLESNVTKVWTSANLPYAWFRFVRFQTSRVV